MNLSTEERGAPTKWKLSSVRVAVPNVEGLLAGAPRLRWSGTHVPAMNKSVQW